MTIRVLVVDDEPIIRQGLKLILAHEQDFDIVGTAIDGQDAIQKAEELRPDVVLLDLRMPGIDGLAAIGPLLSFGSRILILTTFDTDETIQRAFTAGASGFVLKTAHPEDLVHAVRVVARGDALVEPSIARRLIQRFATTPVSIPPTWISLLTEREVKILRHMARGQSNAEIAQSLFLSEATVKSHVSGVLMKLGVRDRLQAVVLAYESGFVDREGH